MSRQEVRNVEVEYKLLDSERANFKFRRSIYVVKDVAEGEKLTKENIRSVPNGRADQAIFNSRLWNILIVTSARLLVDTSSSPTAFLS